MEYMLALFIGEEDRKRLGQADWSAEWAAYTQAMAQAGVLRGGNGLEAPETATVLRLREGRRHVQDGPFGASKEQLGGYYIIDVPALDAALDWASRCPAAANGAVEIRPVLMQPPR